MGKKRKLNYDAVLRDLAAGMPVREVARRHQCSPGSIDRIKKQARKEANEHVPHVPFAAREIRAEVCKKDREAADSLEREIAEYMAGISGWPDHRYEWQGPGMRVVELTREVEEDGEVRKVTKEEAVLGTQKIVMDKKAALDAIEKWMGRASDLRRRAAGMPTSIAGKVEDAEDKGEAENKAPAKLEIEVVDFAGEREQEKVEQ